MHYSWHETIPANTALADKQTRKVEPGGQVLKAIDIEIPYGCAGLARCQLFQGGLQVAPANSPSYYRGHDETIHANMHYDMKKNEAPWYFYTWNLDDTYEHTLTLRMETFQRRELWIRLDPASIKDLFRGLFARFKRS